MKQYLVKANVQVGGVLGSAGLTCVGAFLGPAATTAATRCTWQEVYRWRVNQSIKDPHKATHEQGEATSQHSHRGQQTLRHEVPQAWGAKRWGVFGSVLSPLMLFRCTSSLHMAGVVQEGGRVNPKSADRASEIWGSRRIARVVFDDRPLLPGLLLATTLPRG